MNDKLEFSIAHIGINCENEAEAMEGINFFNKYFSIPENISKGSKGSLYTDTVIEWMKEPGYGEKGHLAIGTKDINEAIIYLKNNGIEFIEESKKYDSNNRLTVIYAKNEILGFAWHLLQI